MKPEASVAWATENTVDHAYSLYLRSLYDVLGDKTNGYIRTHYEVRDFAKAAQNSELITSLVHGQVAGYIIYCSRSNDEHLLHLQAITKPHFEGIGADPDLIAYGLQWVVDPEWRRCGVLRAMIQFLTDNAKPRYFVSSITKGNHFSKSVFESVGGEVLVETEECLIVCYTARRQ